MGDKGNRYSPRLKAEVALSAYRNDRTLSESSAEYSMWRSHLKLRHKGAWNYGEYLAGNQRKKRLA